jgi:hypothetical protein
MNQLVKKEKKKKLKKNKKWKSLISLSRKLIAFLPYSPSYRMPRAELVFPNEPNKPKFIKALS